MNAAERERACWLDWQFEWPRPIPAGRVYFGDETCQELLPSPSQAGDIAKRLADAGVRVTLVTPFLTDDGLTIALRIVEQMLRAHKDLEVVSSDWGLLYRLGNQGVCQPVIGRALAAQAADPRHVRTLTGHRASPAIREIVHLDGTRCQLKRKSPSPELADHLRGMWLDKPEVIEFLGSLGVCRCEVSNLGQGLRLTSVQGWTYSLHVPHVLVAVSRHCPGRSEDFNIRPDCLRDCSHEPIPWQTSSLPVEIYRRHNALYYCWPELPRDLESLPIDRIVESFWRKPL